MHEKNRIEMPEWEACAFWGWGGVGERGAGIPAWRNLKGIYGSTEHHIVCWCNGLIE